MYFYLSLTLSACYSVFLSSLPIDTLMDRDNYLNYLADSLILIARFTDAGLFTLLQNEPIWLFINVALEMSLDRNNALKLIIFSSSFLFSFSILRVVKSDPKYLIFAILICLLPQVMKNYVVHLRQGFAISLFMLSFTVAPIAIRRFLIALTPFVHSSFFFVIANVFLSRLANVNMKMPKGFTLTVMLFIVCMFSLLFIWMLSFSDARQVTELANSDFESRSGVGFVFWTVVLLIYLLNGADFAIRNFLVIASLVNYLLLYFWFSPIARVFESALPLILVTGYWLDKGKRNVFFVLFFLLFLYQWSAQIFGGASIFSAV